MQVSRSFRKYLSILFLAVGLLLLALMAFVFFWPDMEASLFDSSTTASADQALSGLRCPYVMTAAETAQIRAVFENPEEREISFIVRARISQGYVSLIRQDSEVVRIAPGERLEKRWPVTADDAAYGRLIMARIFATRSAASAAQQSSCGILLVNTTAVTGQTLVILGLAGSLLALVVGSGLWWQLERPLNERRRLAARDFGVVTLVVFSSMAAGMGGAWVLSLLLLILSLLLLGAMVERSVRR